MRLKDSDIAKALEATAGNLTLAATMLKCDRCTIWRRLQKSPALVAAKERAEESLLDIAEAQLKKAIGAGEAWAVCFFLKTKGRKRGYNQSQVNLKLTKDDLQQLSDADLNSLIARLDTAPS